MPREAPVTMHTGPSASARVESTRLARGHGDTASGPATATPKAARCFSDLETRDTAERVTEAAAVVMQAAIVSGEVACGDGG